MICTFLDLKLTESIRNLRNSMIDSELQDVSGQTSLHYATLKGEAKMLGLLLHRNADVNAREEYGSTALHNAAWKGHTEAMKVLLDAGADVHTKDKDRSTALHCAAWNGHTEAMKMLLDAGADVNAKEDVDGGSTPLHNAACMGYTEAVKVLLDAGADVNAQREKDGYTTLHFVAESNKMMSTSEEAQELVRLLLKTNANVQAQAKDGRTPLQVAESRKNSHQEVVKLLSDATRHATVE
jgi:ankyrin repeat protein